jgi:hypothetical protein
MVGALLEINLDRHRRYAERGSDRSMTAASAPGTASFIGMAAPAHGLTLMKVEY